ncbi:MAG: autotransporter outer membrane beta-barrel domain-containing protein [Pseudomonadota bacterium]|nr:autotransporter outer membrane beta-barrel domain-containing protein [Pseudomonadota bacterium]
MDNGTVVGGINGNFENNSIDAVNDASGGAIDNSTISQITGNFVGNIASVKDNEVLGGAIYKSTIGKITDDGKVLGGLNGNFENNVAQVKVGGTASASGGAISEGTISQISGNFSGNKAISTGNMAQGGAIYNAVIGEITADGKVLGGINGNFENNTANGASAFGGAINSSTISQITGDFTGNQTIAEKYGTLGGTIYYSTIGKITDDGTALGGINGSFKNNTTQGVSSALGGAIDNSNISQITGDFIGNQAISSASATAGAIFRGTINTIHGDFIENKAIGKANDGEGGAIYEALIGKITEDGKIFGGIEGNLKNNEAHSDTLASGGAIYGGTISQITGDFVENQSISKNGAYGGALSYATIGKITDNGTVLGGINGNFKNNTAQGVTNAQGGAVYSGTISQITGDFTGNKAVASGDTAQGGAIYGGTINVIHGNFSKNQAITSNADTKGGAIYNSTISQIIGNFSENSSMSQGESSYGGAIADSSINTIQGNFTGNHAEAGDRGGAYGGAIYNSTIGKITDDGNVLGGINGNFNNNIAQGTETASGGAIYNSTISQITGDFTGNQTIVEKYGTSGGAITDSTIGKITDDGTALGGINGSFKNNTTQGVSSALGGAIDNSNISQITGDFIGNQAISSASATAGAIFRGTINTIHGDFIENKAIGNTNDGEGGAIYDALIGKIMEDGTVLGGIEGNLKNNEAHSDNLAYGGAISEGTISQVTGNFIENKAVANNGTASGGAINSVTIGKILDDGTIAGGINGNFENNLAQGTMDVHGGAIHLGTISSIHGNFSGNKAITTNGTAQGGAIMNITTNEIVGDFAQNSAVGKISAGGAIYNSDSNSIGSLTGNFNDNSAVSDGLAQGGAIFNQSKIDSISGNFTNNHASSAEFASYGGAILNTGEIGKISNAVFSGNYVEGVTNEAGAVTDGGAVWNAGKITFEGNNVFKDNYKIVDGNKEANDIYNAGAIYVAENGSLDISGGISGNKDAPSSVINIGEGGLLQIHDATVSDNTIYMNADSTLALDVTNFGGSSDEQTGGKIDGNIVLNADSTLKVSTYNVFGEDEGESTYQFATNVDTNNGEWKLDTKVENLLYNYDGPVLNDENNTLTLKYKKKTAEEVADAFGTDMEMSEEILAWSSPKADDNNQFNRISDEINRRAQQGDKSLVNDMSDLHENTQGNLDVARYFGDLVSKNVTEHLNSREGEDLWAYKYGLSGGDAVQRNAQVWVDALFSSAENSGDLDYSSDTTGVIAAVEGKPTQNLLVGAGYAYQQTDMDSGSKSSDIDTHSVFGYGEYSWRQWFVNALVSYNMSSFDQTKKAFGESISSDFDTDVLGAQLLVGQNLGSCNGETLLRIRPQAGVRYYKISQDGYKDSAGVQYGDIDSDVITGVAGVEVVVDTEINNTQVEPKAFVNATYDFQNDDATTVIKLPNGNGYTISQSANGKFGIETGVGIDVKMNDRATVGAMYQYDWRDDYSAHTGLLNVKYAF